MIALLNSILFNSRPFRPLTSRPTFCHPPLLQTLLSNLALSCLSRLDLHTPLVSPCSDGWSIKWKPLTPHHWQPQLSGPRLPSGVYDYGRLGWLGGEDNGSQLGQRMGHGPARARERRDIRWNVVSVQYTLKDIRIDKINPFSYTYPVFLFLYVLGCFSKNSP